MLLIRQASSKLKRLVGSESTMALFVNDIGPGRAGEVSCNVG
jgi:hypothetical protein